jgi:hypothetical protein
MTENIPPLHKKPLADDVSEERFAGDLSGRREPTEKLTGFLSSGPDGAVLAIDSPWSKVKTWFGRHWRVTLAMWDIFTAVGSLEGKAGVR